MRAQIKMHYRKQAYRTLDDVVNKYVVASFLTAIKYPTAFERQPPPEFEMYVNVDDDVPFPALLSVCFYDGILKEHYYTYRVVQC